MSTPALGPRFLLPPRPKLFDWLWAGAAAGLVLGLAELAVAAVRGAALEPWLAALVLGIDAAIVALGSALVAALLRALSIRLSRSGLVGAVVGPLLLAAIAGGFTREWPAHGVERAILLSGLMTAALVAIACGLAASRLADSLERCGVVCSSIYVWGGVALPLAAFERAVHVGWLGGDLGPLWMFAAAAAVAILAWLGVEIAKRRPSRPARRFGSLLAWLVILSAGAAASPVLLPWVLYDRDVTAIDTELPGPPNFLVIVMPEVEVPESVASGYAAPTLARLAREGSSYEIRLGDRDPGVRALLVDGRGDTIVRQLSDAGYVTAAILPSDAAPEELLDAELDASVGARRLLAGSLAWLAAAPWLTGAARPLLVALDLDSETRAADQLAQRAKAWLLDWRSQRAGTPFFLFVDFRAAAVSSSDETPLERSDALLDNLLEHLRTLDIAHSTLVVVLSEGRAQANAIARTADVVLRAPEGWPRLARGTETGALADYLLTASRIVATTPIARPEAAGTP